MKTMRSDPASSRPCNSNWPGTTSRCRPRSSGCATEMAAERAARARTEEQVLALAAGRRAVAGRQRRRSRPRSSERSSSASPNSPRSTSVATKRSRPASAGSSTRPTSAWPPPSSRPPNRSSSSWSSVRSDLETELVHARPERPQVRRPGREDRHPHQRHHRGNREPHRRGVRAGGRARSTVASPAWRRGSTRSRRRRRASRPRSPTSSAAASIRPRDRINERLLDHRGPHQRDRRPAHRRHRRLRRPGERRPRRVPSSCSAIDIAGADARFDEVEHEPRRHRRHASTPSTSTRSTI